MISKVIELQVNFGSSEVVVLLSICNCNIEDRGSERKHGKHSKKTEIVPTRFWNFHCI